MLERYSLPVLLILSLLIPDQTDAQFFQSGQDPAGIRWMQINTPTFQLVYPESFSQEAKRFAFLLEKYRNAVASSLSGKDLHIRKFPVVFHPFSNVSNGFVVWAPWRMEIFPLPPQDIDSEDWLTQLSIHEYRHIVQMQKLNQGFTRWMYYIFGEQAPGALTGLVPRWFLEGDAVHAETAFGNGQRGLLPSFDLEIRTLSLQQNKPFPFIKALRGSYKDYVPDYYQYGYKISSWLRYHYGINLFDSTLNYVARKPFLLYSFSHSLKKQTGIPPARAYAGTLNELKEVWKTQEPFEIFPEVKILTRRKSQDYIQYRFPVYLNDSVIIAQKSGLGVAESFVAIYRDGREKVLRTAGFGNRVNLSSRKGQLVWTENQPDPRWANRGYSVIRRLDLRRNTFYEITRNTRYFAPALSPDAKTIAAVEITPGNHVFLVILDTWSGQVQKRISPPQKVLILQPCYTSDTTIAMFVQESSGKSIREYSIHADAWKTLLAPTRQEISDLTAYGDWLFFRSGFTGLGNIFALHRITHKIWQVTSVRFGAAYPSVSPDGTRIAFSMYSEKGYDVVEIPLDTSLWKPWNNHYFEGIDIYKKVTSDENPNLPKPEPVSDMPEFKEKRYRKALHLFGFHSWLPFYANYDAIREGDLLLSNGLTLLGQNLLATSFTNLALDFSTGSPVWKASWTYTGFFPAFNLQVGYGGLPDVYRAGVEGLPPVKKDYLRLIGKIYLPLNFSSGGYVQYLQPSFESEYGNDWFYEPENSSYSRGITYLRTRLYGYRYRRLSPRDIRPRYGQIIDFRCHFAPFDLHQIGSMGTVAFGMFLPGIGRHHSIYTSISYQKQFYEDSRYLYSSGITFPRGYTSLPATQLQNYTIDYQFPLVYPDVHLGTLFYGKRIRAEIFTDYATGNIYRNSEGSYRLEKEEFLSSGMTLYLDFHFFQLIFPFSAGLRGIYFPYRHTLRFDPVISIDLNDF